LANSNYFMIMALRPRHPGAVRIHAVGWTPPTDADPIQVLHSLVRNEGLEVTDRRTEKHKGVVSVAATVNWEDRSHDPFARNTRDLEDQRVDLRSSFAGEGTARSGLVSAENTGYGSRGNENCV
jgi:hypothetical protein